MSNTKQTFKTVAQFDIRPVTGKHSVVAKYFGNSDVKSVADKIATEAGLFSVNWKSKAWKRFCMSANKVTAQALREKFDLSHNVSVAFNQNAGCSCGCSPGFVIRGKNDAGKNELQKKQLAGTDIFGDLKFSKDDIRFFTSVQGSLFNREFNAELAADYEKA